VLYAAGLMLHSARSQASQPPPNAR
jgi:hypothetical protein